LSESETQPKLAKPGAGLPPLEWAVAKFILLPKAYKVLDKEKSLKAFSIESSKIISLARPLSTDQLSQRRLVPRLRGLEDSSRFWSVAMTLEHTIIVGDLMRQAVVELSNGASDLPVVSTADVKPDQPVEAAAIIEKFEAMSKRFIADVTASNIDAHPNNTHPHPWFGPLTARKWMVFGSLHLSIHRQQIKEIIQRL